MSFRLPPISFGGGLSRFVDAPDQPYGRRLEERPLSIKQWRKRSWCFRLSFPDLFNETQSEPRHAALASMIPVETVAPPMQRG
jgi:hypothetical protein